MYVYMQHLWVIYCIVYQLLRQCFNAWLDVVNNAKLIKERAYAMWVWQTKCRVFQSWRRIVEQSKRQQELATLALQLQWEKRYEMYDGPAELISYKFSQMLGDVLSSLSPHTGCQGVHFLETVVTWLSRGTVNGANETTAASQDDCSSV